MENKKGLIVTLIIVLVIGLGAVSFLLFRSRGLSFPPPRLAGIPPLC